MKDKFENESLEMMQDNKMEGKKSFVEVEL